MFSCAVQRPSGLKVFAYRQPVLQGAAPTAIVDDKGNTYPTEMRERANYFIYIESPSNDIEVPEVWIRKAFYKTGTAQISNTPVLMLTSMIPGARPDTLVGRTSNKVLQVSLQSMEGAVKPSSRLQRMINSNELVLHCVIAGKDHYYPVRAIKNLPPVALQ